jgi:hypothetical protein
MTCVVILSPGNPHLEFEINPKKGVSYSNLGSFIQNVTAQAQMG